MNEAFSPPRVKVCGLTRAVDVRVAIEAGARALGFVHHAPSPRSLSAREAAPLAALVPDQVLTVAVLVEVQPADALAFARQARLRAVQLCGAQSPQDWSDFPLPILRRVAVDEEALTEAESWRGVADAFVLDFPGSPGGSGQTVELELAARLAASYPCLLAGGLDERNVSERIAAVRPAGVDASSRLEQSPGNKDGLRVRAFVEHALAALKKVKS